VTEGFEENVATEIQRPSLRERSSDTGVEPSALVRADATTSEPPQIVRPRRPVFGSEADQPTTRTMTPITAPSTPVPSARSNAIPSPDEASAAAPTRVEEPEALATQLSQPRLLPELLPASANASHLIGTQAALSAPEPRSRAGSDAKPLSRVHAAASTTDEIQIHIGRIEVAAIAPPPVQTPAAKPSRRPFSLDEYLRARDGRAS